MNETKNFPEQRWNAQVCLDTSNEALKRGTVCFPSYLRVFDVFFPLFTGELRWRLARRLPCFSGRFSSVPASVAIV
jgi:hypothetical protein